MTDFPILEGIAANAKGALDSVASLAPASARDVGLLVPAICSPFGMNILPLRVRARLSCSLDRSLGAKEAPDVLAQARSAPEGDLGAIASLEREEPRLAAEVNRLEFEAQVADVRRDDAMRHALGVQRDALLERSLDVRGQLDRLRGKADSSW